LAERLCGGFIGPSSASRRIRRVDLRTQGRSQHLFLAAYDVVICPLREQAGYLCMAGALLKEGRVNEAINHSLEAVRIKPDFIETLNDYGSILYKTGRINEAIECFKMALKVSPADAEVNANIGVALATKGDFAQAEQHYRIAVQRINTPAIHNNLGYALANMGKLDGAIEHFEMALKIRPDYDSAKVNLDITLAEKQKLKNEISQNSKK
jgi:tetratricopeptide (TPR) repeat protein